VPAGARLLTAIAVPETPPGATAARRSAFRDPVRERTGTVLPLYERVLDGAPRGDRRWVDVGVALDGLAGRSGTLRFDVAPARARHGAGGGGRRPSSSSATTTRRACS
jgi:hypothetical protein